MPSECPMCDGDLLDGKHVVEQWQGFTFLACPSAPPEVVYFMDLNLLRQAKNPSDETPTK